MSAITLETAQKHLAAWLEAELVVSNSQSYKIGTRNLTYADLGQIRQQIKYWKKQVEQLSKRGRNRVMRAVPRDL